MSDFHDLLHVARASACNAQQMSPLGTKMGVIRQAPTALKAASMLVLERNRLCRERARSRLKTVQQTPITNTPFVAPEFALAGRLAELNGLLARVVRNHPGGDPAAIYAIGIREIDGVLRSFRALAAGVPVRGQPTSFTHWPEHRDES